MVSRKTIITTALVFLPLATLCWSAELRTIALTGQLAPGTDGQTAFSGFRTSFPGLPVINSSGQVAYTAALSGPGVDSTNSLGIWAGDTESQELIGRSGSQVPNEATSVKFEGFDSVYLNSDGRVTFSAGTNEVDANGRHANGIWSGEHGELSLLAKAFDPAPDLTDGSAYSNIGPTILNSATRTVFEAYLTDGITGENRIGIFSGTPDDVRLIARTGDQAPGAPIDTHFIAFEMVSANSQGEVTFLGLADGDGEIWSERNGTLQLIIRPGDPLPGSLYGTYNGCAKVTSNSAGEIAFHDETGIWEYQDDAFRLVVPIGMQAPGIANEAHLGGFFSEINLNSAGHVVFVGYLFGSDVESTNDSGIWVEGSDRVHLVARTGDVVPGSDSEVFRWFGSPSINALGQAAFYAETDTTGGFGIWATDTSHTLHLIAKKGDILEVAPDDFRTISNVIFQNNTGNDDGRPSGFNDRGQLVFWAQFTDGSEGIFVSNAVAVPEPNCFLAVAVILALAASSRLRLGGRSFN